jgi:hypothetical protein
MPGESRSLSPVGNHPAKRQRLGEFPNNKTSTTVISPKSPETQSLVCDIDDLGLDRQQDSLPKLTADGDGFDAALSRQNNAGLQSGHDELLPGAICNSSIFEEFGSPCLLGETLTQFCPNTELSSLPIQQPWSTYVEANPISDGDSLLSMAGDPLAQNKCASAELFPLQGLEGLEGHNAEDAFSLSELKESADNGEDENVCFGMVSSVNHVVTVHKLICAGPDKGYL